MTYLGRVGFAGLLLSIFAGCAAADGEKVASGEAAVVGDISSMQARSDGNFDVTCKDGSHEVISQDDLLANRVCGHSPASSIGTVFGSSDSCASSSLVAFIRDTTDCNTLGSASAWSIMVDGKCVDISDTTATNACQEVKRRTPTGYAIFGSSDSCAEGSLLTTMRETTDCTTLGTSGSAWSIRIKDQCIDISDTNPQHACEVLKSRIPTGYSIFGSSDSCAATSLVTNIRETTDCNTLSASDSSWSISINGQCIDLSDTNVRNACVELKRRIP